MPSESLMWNRAAETMPREQLQALQLQRLRAMVARVSANVPFYAKRLAAAGVMADTIQSLDDLARIPFTLKSDLRDNYPFGLFGVPLEDIVRIHASSGTTGKPIVGPYTRSD